MPRAWAPARARRTVSGEQHERSAAAAAGSCQRRIVTPTTSWPASRRSIAATALSTPPLMATATRPARRGMPVAPSRRECHDSSARATASSTISAPWTRAGPSPPRSASSACADSRIASSSERAHEPRAGRARRRRGGAAPEGLEARAADPAGADRQRDAHQVAAGGAAGLPHRVRRIDRPRRPRGTPDGASPQGGREAPDEATTAPFGPRRPVRGLPAVPGIPRGTVQTVRAPGWSWCPRPPRRGWPPRCRRRRRSTGAGCRRPPARSTG